MNDETKRLAGELGISPKQLAKLADKYEDSLESVLSRWWNEMQEAHNKQEFLGRQGDLVTSTFAALKTSSPDDPRRHPEPAVDREYQAEITHLAHKRWDRYMRDDRAEELAKQELRSVNQALREVALQAVKAGVDPGPLLESVKAQIAAQAAENERKAA
jgi:5'-3' exonuclease